MGNIIQGIMDQISIFSQTFAMHFLYVVVLYVLLPPFCAIILFGFILKARKRMFTIPVIIVFIISIIIFAMYGWPNITNYKAP